MKKIILLMAISFSILMSQSCSNDAKTKGSDKDEVSSSSVPGPVKSAFESKYPTAQEVKWEDAHEDNLQTYKAKFMLGDKKMKAEFDTTGKLVKESED